MSNLADLLSLALNVIFVFATAAYVASSATDAILNLLQSREKMLLSGVKELLNDPGFAGLARAIYNNGPVNPRASGGADNEAQLKFKPANIKPEAFAIALLELLHVVETPRDPDPNLQELRQIDERSSIENKIDNANIVIDHHIRQEEKGNKQLKQFIANIVIRNNGNRVDMEKAVAAWFEAGMAHIGNSFRKQTAVSNFAVAFVVAAVLDLKPIPVGGFAALLNFKAATPAGTAIAGYVPHLIGGFEWTVVGLSALLGAPFWFNALKMFQTGAGRPPVAPAPAQVSPPPPVTPAAAPEQPPKTP